MIVFYPAIKKVDILVNFNANDNKSVLAILYPLIASLHVGILLVLRLTK